MTGYNAYEHDAKYCLDGDVDTYCASNCVFYNSKGSGQVTLPFARNLALVLCHNACLWLSVCSRFAACCLTCESPWIRCCSVLPGVFCRRAR